MRHLRHSTSGTFSVGPFLQVSDGFTPASGLSSQTGTLYKRGNAEPFTPASWTEDADGYYIVATSGQNLDTLGHTRLQFSDFTTT